MKIGIIGSGGIGRLYASLWVRAGHEVFLSSRNPESLQRFAEELGPAARFGSVREAAAFGDVLLLASNYDSVQEAIENIREAAAGKLIIDSTNPLKLDADGALKRLIPDDEAAGVVMQSLIPQARVAKAFTSLWTGHVEQHADVQNPTAAMPYAADAATDRDTVRGLIADAGLVPVDIGTLAESAALDPQSPAWNVVLTAAELWERVNEFRDTSSH